jgi:hypothetical protein
MQLQLLLNEVLSPIRTPCRECSTPIEQLPIFSFNFSTQVTHDCIPDTGTDTKVARRTTPASAAESQCNRQSNDLLKTLDQIDNHTAAAA